MRGGVDGLPTPHSLGGALPGAFFGGDFTEGLVAAFDEVLAPIFATLDDFDAYLDPRYAPEDILRWLSGWLGFPTDERWSEDRLRGQFAAAVEAMRWRGTVRGVAAAVRAYTGHEPEVTDSGGVSSSGRPLGELPGQARPWLLVRVTGVGSVDLDVLHRLVGAACPAHVPFEVRINDG